MDLIKQYISQCIIAAANNLRLNTEKIEIVALLREYISKTDDLENSLKEMKKVTELSTFAIRVNEIYNYIGKSKVDFLKLSDKFKEHCHFLVRDLNILLDKISPQHLNQIIQKIENESNEVFVNLDNIADDTKPQAEGISIKIPGRNPISDNEDAIEHGISTPNETLNESLEESLSINIESGSNEFLFEDFEVKIIAPMKELDSLLKNLVNETFDKDELEKYYNLMVDHSQLAEKAGFQIIANMHKVFAVGLKLLINDELEPQKEVIESMRACLIVIVAVVRGKEVDISSYLTLAEEFGRYIYNI